MTKDLLQAKFERNATQVFELSKPGKDIIFELTPQNAHLWHMATGVSGEVGELLDAIKKVAIYNKDIDRTNVVEELGDLWFYMVGIMQALDITKEEMLDHNYEKLSKRYSQGTYSNQQAQDREDKK